MGSMEDSRPVRFWINPETGEPDVLLPSWNDIKELEAKVEILEQGIQSRDEIINDLRKQLKVREINKVGELIESE